jgi:putative pyruvate formate lyase activating enzyme
MKLRVLKAPPRVLHGDGRFVLPRADFRAAYLQTHAEGRLRPKVEAAREMLRRCRVCPRNCDVNRLENDVGQCRSGRWTRIASAFPHRGEEDCLRGWNGSGTIFFSWCNLRCCFCQNEAVSQLGEGNEVQAEDLAALMLYLQEVGCHNLNLVTPEHVVPQLLEALLIAVEHGLHLPLVYNTSAYDSLESLRLLDGVVDLYLPDFKVWEPERSQEFLGARDYPTVACAAIRAMHHQVGELRVDAEGLALRGVLLRHLVLPGQLADTRAILNWVAKELSPDTYLHLMDQYQPAGRVLTERRFQDLDRTVSPGEFALAQEAARAAGLWRLGGVQDQ